MTDRTELQTRPGLSPEQLTLLRKWLPGAVLERDHSWASGIRSVLEVSHTGDRFIIKAGKPDDHHMDREITAHQKWLEPWASHRRAPILVHADRPTRLLVTTYLPGNLVLGTAWAEVPDIYAQAGRLLGMLHRQASTTDPIDEARQNARSIAWLDSEHRIDSQTERALRAQITSWPTPASVVVPTHGDWQPRNWLVHDGRVAVIDFGRTALRPAMTDLSRLAAQDFARDEWLEAAFLDGYGSDPREPSAWHRTRVREAIGTAVWAYQVRDTEFEAQGHRMITAALATSL